GNFTYCKNVDIEKTCKLGLAGITLQTNDSLASIDIKMQNQNQFHNYNFNTVKILHNNTKNYQLKVNNKLAYYVDSTSSEFLLNECSDSIHFEIKAKTKSSKNFSLYGFILNNNLKGINYHTIGVNGATAKSYLKCELFSEQLKTLNPDWIIVSLGTNEAYNKNFDLTKFKKNYTELINKIKSTAPNAYILLTTPGDHLKNKKYINKNIPIVCKSIANTASEKNTGLWDFYTIMGGKNSINKWYNNKLTAKDKIHLNKFGYDLKGKLLYYAFIKNFLSKSGKLTNQIKN
ncbi:MAG: GDSL-type esterase/lipase family protein, partial [Bacteroidota bacterium]|nr:GDSL-type esterase/lipase family protein [Bacteroidota bacterium]